MARNARSAEGRAAALVDAKTRSRALVIACASRNDGSCPGEVSKTWRLAQIARETIEQGGIEVDCST